MTHRQAHLPAPVLAEARRVLYGYNQGAPVQAVPLNDDLQRAAEAKEFDAQHYAFGAAPEQLRAPRPVRIGLIQHAMPVPATAPYAEQITVRDTFATLLTPIATTHCFRL